MANIRPSGFIEALIDKNEGMEAVIHKNQNSGKFYVNLRDIDAQEVVGTQICPTLDVARACARKMLGKGISIQLEKASKTALHILEYAADTWWDQLNNEEKKAYIKAHPRSKYAKTSIAPVKSNELYHQKSKEYNDLLERQRYLEGITPAIRDPGTGKIYSGSIREYHKDIYKRMPDDARKRFDATNVSDPDSEMPFDLDGPNVGFIKNGKFVPRTFFDQDMPVAVENLNEFRNGLKKEIYDAGMELRKFHEGSSVLDKCNNFEDNCYEK